MTADASTNWTRNESRHLIELTNAVEQARLEKRVQKEREKLGLPESSAFSSQKKPSLFNQLRPSKQKDEKSSQAIEEKDNNNEEDEEDSFDLDDSSEEYDPSKPEKHKSDKNKSALSGMIQTSGNPENEIYLGKIPTILRKKIYPEAIASKTIGLEALMSSITSANLNQYISNDEYMEDGLDEEESDIDIDDPLGEKVKKIIGKSKNEEDEIEFDKSGNQQLWKMQTEPTKTTTEGDVFTMFMSRMKKVADASVKEIGNNKFVAASTNQPTEDEGSEQALRINRFKLLQKKKQEETTALAKQSQGKKKGEA
ncbi:uncharacterized protein MONOS_14324c2 [Monocercomonoides exilis]|uniref:uncharacterized protein n=1 Tax=Monocercomonoides exilis TaxID=2049356 RepID=UPI0035596BC0|nr:hypothetical protein MONOS_14324c1 [Monocercomonoides exilis]KAH7824973.1 hypothetical protein MONOS_14324c2 [Monocercomonoides exilis]|eukprot:MONOS_14324.1-p1 / transcript=MONOS_14324.1 / gene=MONOS_14324 / organism=Monocercomonoides_exilis_PA203 / gene_product=unspecified product / transcript_product=unspecified product / location=Mono_scaffold00981:3967-5928(+) / protein_length=311 / sequence_SO=supercontig / SO=protein_coding / is_pseudo=false